MVKFVGLGITIVPPILEYQVTVLPVPLLTALLASFRLNVAVLPTVAHSVSDVGKAVGGAATMMEIGIGLDVQGPAPVTVA